MNPSKIQQRKKLKQTENKFQKDFELLIRSKHIEKQTHKDRSERLENTKGIFEATRKENLQRDRKSVV